MKQSPKERYDTRQQDDFMFYDIGAQEELNVLSQPLGLLKKKKKTGISISHSNGISIFS
jgi:hypothetical protein